MRRGRAHAENLWVGDTVDFWRVEAYEPDHRLRLVAEMKLPGRAWLEFEVTGDQESSTITQTAIYDPIGLFGRLYWYAVCPLHHFVFSGICGISPPQHNALKYRRSKKNLPLPDSPVDPLLCFSL